MKTINLVVAIISYVLSFCCLVALASAESYEVGTDLFGAIIWALMGWLLNANYIVLKQYEKK
jgi:hypothetical protein